MKYLPLVWAAVMRKPARAVLTLLSVMLAFTLFGLTIGMNATFDKVSAAARADRIYTGARFGGAIPRALVGEIERMPGVALVASNGFIGGYHQDLKDRAFVLMEDDQTGRVMTEWPVSPAQWEMLRKDRMGIIVSQRQAITRHLKPGDTFTIISPSNKKADGSTTWTFKVLSIAGDITYMTGGYMLGNYDYFDKARPPAEQGKVGQIVVQASDPGHTADLAQRIDERFANSATPLQSTTEKAALDINNNTGMDIASVDRDIALSGMFMVLFLTANGIARAVRERFAEFATLKTIGFSGRGVIGLVFAEAAMPCLLGAVLGIGLAQVISIVMPLMLPPSQGLPVPTMSAMVLVWAAICAAFVALTSSALPALRLGRMDIATALSGR